MTSIAARLEELMRQRGVKSQSRLARMSGVPQSTIHRILSKGDAYSPTWQTLQKLARTLNISAQWLAEGDGAAAPYRLDSDSTEQRLGYGALTDIRILEAIAILQRLDDGARGKVLDVLRLLDRPA